MRLIKTITLQLLEDRGWIKMRANMVDNEGNLAKGMLIPIAKLNLNSKKENDEK